MIIFVVKDAPLNTKVKKWLTCADCCQLSNIEREMVFILVLMWNSDASLLHNLWQEESAMMKLIYVISVIPPKLTRMTSRKCALWEILMKKLLSHRNRNAFCRVLRLKNLSKEKWSKRNFYNLMIKGKFSKALQNCLGVV